MSATVLPFAKPNTFYECLQCDDLSTSPGECQRCHVPFYRIGKDGDQDYRINRSTPQGMQLRPPVDTEGVLRAFGIAMVLAIMLGSVAGWYFTHITQAIIQ